MFQLDIHGGSQKLLDSGQLEARRVVNEIFRLRCVTHSHDTPPSTLACGICYYTSITILTWPRSLVFVKVYPKIPRYDHPVVPDDYFKSEDLVLVEKFDGSSFRFTLYDDRYADAYPDLVTETADRDGSLVFGTRKSIRGSHRDPLSDIDGALHRAVRCLRECVDIAALRTLHDDYGCPLVVYVENMVYSTLDCGYTERELPALVGFDVLPYDAIEETKPHGNPYEETQEGFLDIDDVQTVLDCIRVGDTPGEHALVPATILRRPESPFDPTDYEFPMSSLADDVRVEGVVVRSDSRERR